tara:strand:+ start:452 stop:826 length:375 start_codon:yes stop_codon:yes gene_type:complete
MGLDVFAESFELLFLNTVNSAIKQIDLTLSDLDLIGITGAVFSFQDTSGIGSLTTTANSVTLSLTPNDAAFFVWGPDQRVVVDIQTQHTVPEPTSLALLVIGGVGLFGVGFFGYGRQGKRERAA